MEDPLKEFREKSSTRFPVWDELYKNTEVETMPWFHKNLDEDLEKEINKLKIKSGTFLDIGTGPGTQAVEIAKNGFDVTATDISETAINKAKKLSDNIKFITDDILLTNLTNKFDFVFDRGVFHVLSPEDQPTYVNNIKRLLNINGILFLKCFSDKQPEWKYGPHRFSKNDIETIFTKDFNIEEIRDTIFEGEIHPSPKALFVVMRRKDS